MTEDATILTSKGSAKNSALARALGSNFFDITVGSIVASPDWQGYAVRFQRDCVVTIPADLPADFSCGWSQESTGVITFQAAQGVTLQSQGNLIHSGGQYAIGGISGWGPGVFRLYGGMA